jgi:hypothetical protein
LTVDTGANQETVVVSSVNMTPPNSGSPNFTANFAKTHVAGFPIFVPKYGNPGPQPQWTVRDNSAVVLYASIID